MLTILNQLKQLAVISPLDYQFAQLIEQKQQAYAYPQPIADLAVLLAALSSYHSQNGSSCINPQDFINADFFDLAMQPEYRPHLQQIRQRIATMPPEQWQRLLQRHIAFSAQPEQACPLFWSNGLLYFYRNWLDERQVAHYLLQRLSQDVALIENEKLSLLLQQLFPDNSDIDWQKIAVATALKKNFSLISGGPGTGKTRTVCSLLLALQWQQQQLALEPLKIALVAPTGKASARLSESISNSLTQLPAEIDPALKRQIPTKAQTLHRLLGITNTAQQNAKAHYQQSYPLPFDLLVVDEASMVDLNLFAQLLNALSPQTRLVLLGDKDQLASVEAGAVMAELCKFLAQGYSTEHCDYLYQVTGQRLEPRLSGHPMRDCLCFLQKSYRFGQDSGIKALADSINQQQNDRRHKENSWALFAQYPQDLTLYCYPLAEKSQQSKPESNSVNRTLISIELILKQATAWYGDYLQAIDRFEDFSPKSLRPIFKAFNQVRLLTALRSGEFGVEQLNIAISERLRQKGLLQFRFWHEWYHGKPIMVLQNDSAVELYNGDIGLFLTDKHGNSRVCFESGEGQYRDISPNRVPPHEAAFTMTVHKSQGSEFEHTALILPLNISPVLSRELLYTAITRAKSHFSLFASQRVWQSAVQKPILRSSGLYLEISKND